MKSVQPLLPRPVLIICLVLALLVCIRHSRDALQLWRGRHDVDAIISGCCAVAFAAAVLLIIWVLGRRRSQ